MKDKAPAITPALSFNTSTVQYLHVVCFFGSPQNVISICAEGAAGEISPLPPALCCRGVRGPRLEILIYSRRRCGH